MSFSILVHPKVHAYVALLSKVERTRCHGKLKMLAEDPFTPRAGCDIKKLSSRKNYFRLRVGPHRFLYLVEGNEVFVEEAFRRGKGYMVKEEPDGLEEK